MKSTLFATLFLLSLIGFTTSFAQECEIHLSAVVIPSHEEIPVEIQEQLLNRICQVVSQDGVLVNADYSQFFIGAKFSTLYKETLSGPPVMTALTTQLNLFVSDALTGTVYATTSMELKGVGKGDERSYQNAVRNLKKENAKVNELIKIGKQKIISYYDNNYTRILNKAALCATQKNFEEALFLLTAIPDCCAGYNEAVQQILIVYKNYIDNQCHKLLNEANLAWAKSPDKDGAEEVATFLAKIDPDAACYEESVSLFKEIKSKIKEDWNFEMRQKYADQLDLKKSVLAAAKEVGVAYGSNQQPNTTNLLIK